MLKRPPAWARATGTAPVVTGREQEPWNTSHLIIQYGDPVASFPFFDSTPDTPTTQVSHSVIPAPAPHCSSTTCCVAVCQFGHGHRSRARCITRELGHRPRHDNDTFVHLCQCPRVPPPLLQPKSKTLTHTPTAAAAAATAIAGTAAGTAAGTVAAAAAALHFNVSARRSKSHLDNRHPLNGAVPDPNAHLSFPSWYSDTTPRSHHLWLRLRVEVTGTTQARPRLGSVPNSKVQQGTASYHHLLGQLT